MNKMKEMILAGLNKLHEKGGVLNDSDKLTVAFAIAHIEATPVTYDKNTVVTALACYGCPKNASCTKEFDRLDSGCRKEYEDAEFFYELQILDEHDEDLEVKA